MTTESGASDRKDSLPSGGEANKKELQPYDFEYCEACRSGNPSECRMWTCGGIWCRDKEIYHLKTRNEELENEVALDNKLLEGRAQIHKAFPCPTHGEGCVLGTIDAQRAKIQERDHRYETLLKAYSEQQKRNESLEKLVQEGLEREKELREYVKHDLDCHFECRVDKKACIYSRKCTCGLSELLEARSRGGE